MVKAGPQRWRESLSEGIRSFSLAWPALPQFPGNDASGRRRGDLFGGDALAAAMVQIYKLVCGRDVTNNVELANGFGLRNRKGRGRSGKSPAFERVLRPLAGFGQVFQSVLVLDENVHSTEPNTAARGGPR